MELNCEEPIRIIATYIQLSLDDILEKVEAITDDDGNIIESYQDNYNDYKKRWEMYTKEMTSKICFSVVDNTSRDESFLSHLFPSNIEHMSSDSLRSCCITASGKVSFAYRPSPEVYEIIDQQLELNSKDSALSFVYVFPEESNQKPSIKLSGYVDGATLSRMDLFPNFRDWYFSNIYMVPLTLVSTVIAAMSMLYSTRKNKKEQNEIVVYIKHD